MLHRAWDSLQEHLGHHPVATTAGGVMAGVSGMAVAATGIAGLEQYPTLQHAVGFLAAALTAVSFLYVPMRGFLRRVVNYMDPKEGAAAKTTKLVGILTEELKANTELTHKLLGESVRTQRIMLEATDAKEMVEEVRSQVVGTREDFASLKEIVKGSFDKLRTDFNGLGKSLRSDMDEMREELRRHGEELRESKIERAQFAERLAKLENHKGGHRKE